MCTRISLPTPSPPRYLYIVYTNRFYTSVGAGQIYVKHTVGASATLGGKMVRQRWAAFGFMIEPFHCCKHPLRYIHFRGFKRAYYKTPSGHGDLIAFG